MDYLLRDSLFCGVRYGTFDLERLLDTMLPIEDPETGEWGVGVEEGGVHAVEALVMARYYMFTQVYFNVTGKALELHLNEWLEEQRRPLGGGAGGLPRRRTTSRSGRPCARSARAPRPRAGRAPRTSRSPSRPASTSPARRRSASRRCSRSCARRFGPGSLLVSNSAKDPHRLGTQPRPGAALRRLARSRWSRPSQFIRHLSRIDRYRVYTPPPLRDEVAAALREQWTEA